MPEPRAARWGELSASLGVYLPGYPVVTPPERLAVDVVLDPRDVAARKVRALAAQATQTAGLIATLGVDRYTAWVGEESFVEAARVRPRERVAGRVGHRLRFRSIASRATGGPRRGSTAAVGGRVGRAPRSTAGASGA